MRRFILLALALGIIPLGCGRAGLLDDRVPPSPSTIADAAGAAAETGDELTMDAGVRNPPPTMPIDAGVGDRATPLGIRPEAGPGPCNVFTCAGGCCQPDGSCFVWGPGPDGVLPTPPFPCGSGGEACVTCGAGDTCIAGSCGRDLGAVCTPENCSGCCLVAFTGSVSSTQCFTGSQDRYCGSGGGQCTECTAATNGGHCVADPSGGHCEGVGVCNGTNCAGCCSGNLCVVGTQDVGCGNAGAPCQDCAADGGICYGERQPDGSIPLGCGYDCFDGPPCREFCPMAETCTVP